MTVHVERIALLPNVPAVCTLYGGRGQGLHVAYVGIAERLRRRIEQHLENRDSSVTTGTATAGIHAERVTEVRYWTHHSFTDRVAREAAEMIASEVLDPALRGRSRTQKHARIRASDPPFAAEMRELFQAPPAGRLTVPTLQDAFDRIAELERRLADLERRHR